MAAVAVSSDRVLCVTLNLALDVTYLAPTFMAGGLNRVRRVHAQAGGKGVNVARLLQVLGHRVTVSGFIGGPAAAEIACSLELASLKRELVPCSGASRRTLTAVSTIDGAATEYCEPGPHISDEEWLAFIAAYEALLTTSRMVVLSGSLPPGVPVDGYGRLTELARRRDIPVVVDAQGDALVAALPVRPWLVKPNERELADAVQISVPISIDDAVVAARSLVAQGAQCVVVSLGPRGLIGVRGDEAALAVPPTVVGSPVGAGDAVVAAMVHGELLGRPWPEMLRTAAAMSAAAVRKPVAGVLDSCDAAELCAGVEVHQL